LAQRHHESEFRATLMALPDRLYTMSHFTLQLSPAEAGDGIAIAPIRAPAAMSSFALPAGSDNTLFFLMNRLLMVEQGVKS
jgi:hypothetical protein